MVAHGVRRTSNRVHTHKAARQPRRPSSSPPVISVGHAPDLAVLPMPIHADQPDTAMRAIRGLLSSRGRMAVFGACHPWLIGIHGSAALGTVANRRVIAAMIEIRTGRAQEHSHSLPHACERADGSRRRAVVTLSDQRIRPRFRTLFQSAQSRRSTYSSENARGVFESAPDT
jgi:hypothetical protein